MKKSQKKAAFQFIKFFITESYFNFVEEGNYNLSVSIIPSGSVFPELHQFHLFLNVTVKDKDDKFECNIKSTSIFNFPEDVDIEQYKSSFFTTNAPAITFPYIRAYIANLTAQSGIMNILLPTLNLSNLAKSLKENISFQE